MREVLITVCLIIFVLGLIALVALSLDKPEVVKQIVEALTDLAYVMLKSVSQRGVPSSVLTT